MASSTGATRPPPPTTSDQPSSPPPSSFPAGQLRPHLSAANPAALTSRIILAAALRSSLKPGKEWAETRPGPFSSSPPPTHLGSSGAGNKCSCHSLTLTNRRGHSNRLPLNPACSTSTESSGAGSEETGSSVALGPGRPLSLDLARPSHISVVPARLPRGLLRPTPGGWPRPSRCGPSNHIRGSAGAVARVIFWLRPDRRGVCALVPMHLPKLGACGRACGPGLEWSEVSRSPQHPFFLTHTPQPHALGVPPADGEPAAGGWRWT